MAAADAVVQVLAAADAVGLARCHAIRRAVFIVEQRVPEALELDGDDAACVHFLATVGRVDAGTARLRLLGGGDAKAQRVAVVAAHRGCGIGALLMRALEAEARIRGAGRVRLGSQVHALHFYERLGYTVVGAQYEEAGIAHCDMEKPLA